MATQRLHIPLRLRSSVPWPTPVQTSLDLTALSRDQLQPGERLDLRSLCLRRGKHHTPTPLQVRAGDGYRAGGRLKLDLAWIEGIDGEREHTLEAAIVEGDADGADEAEAPAEGAPGRDAPPLSFPRAQMLPQPGGVVECRADNAVRFAYHYAPADSKPYLHPLVGPAGVSLTRMGHPADAEGRRHQHAVWVAHREINGINFWDDSPGNGAQVHQSLPDIEDGPLAARLGASLYWEAPGGVPLLAERRGLVAWLLPGGEMALDLTIELHALERPVRFGRTPFGFVGVRVARTMSVRYGGGTISAATGMRNEAGVLHTRARWCDYSGPVTADAWNGVALFDHADNPHHPCYWQVRDDGWMGTATCFERELELEPEQSLTLRHRLLTHAGDAETSGVGERYETYIEPPTVAVGEPHRGGE